MSENSTDRDRLRAWRAELLDIRAGKRSHFVEADCEHSIRALCRKLGLYAEQWLASPAVSPAPSAGQQEGA